MKRIIALGLLVIAAACSGDVADQSSSSTGGSTAPTTTIAPTTTPPTTDPNQAEHDVLVGARDRWAAAGMNEYDYSFSRRCFCREEYLGPYDVVVRDGSITVARLHGVDLLTIQGLDLSGYEQIIFTVDGLFDEIERALAEAASLTVEYEPDLGYPTRVAIDWMANVADDEIEYSIADLHPPVTLTECSTSGLAVDLVDQPELPTVVAATRQSIYNAAMACDFDALVALAEVGDSPLLTTFGGGGVEIFLEREAEGDPILRTLVEHLNQPYATLDDGAGTVYYAWPSAFVNLEAPDGTGLPPEEYEALLTLYTVDELEEMFDGIGGYVGWRNGIADDGEWVYFVAGD